MRARVATGHGAERARARARRVTALSHCRPAVRLTNQALAGPFAPAVRLALRRGLVRVALALAVVAGVVAWTCEAWR